MTTAYDQDNIFAKILRGELPCEQVYEDEQTIAIMDIMPRAGGHTLVLPKAPSRNIFDIDPAAYAHVSATVKTIASAVMRAFEADGITIQQFNEPAGGQVVFHTHVHVIPRHDGISLGPHTGDMADGAVLKDHADRIRAVLKNG